MVDHMNKRYSKQLDGTVLTATQIKPHLSLFVAATIESPAFDSQMKVRVRVRVRVRPLLRVLLSTPK